MKLILFEQNSISNTGAIAIARVYGEKCTDVTSRSSLRVATRVVIELAREGARGRVSEGASLETEGEWGGVRSSFPQKNSG